MSSEPCQRTFSDAQNAVGIAAVCVSMMINLPQLYKVIKTKKSQDLSYWTYILICLSSVLWITYHYLSGTYHGMVSASFTLVTASIIIFFIVYQNKQEKNKILTKSRHLN